MNNYYGLTMAGRAINQPTSYIYSQVTGVADKKNPDVAHHLNYLHKAVTSITTPWALWCVSYMMCVVYSILTITHILLFMILYDFGEGLGGL